MKIAADDDGYWFATTAGGRVGSHCVEPESVGPLVEPPRLWRRWVQPEADARGLGSTEFTQWQAGWHTFTVRHYRWRADDGSQVVDYEIVMRDPAADEFLNPEPPEGAPTERWSADGKRLL
jgi:hypothetical protein